MESNESAFSTFTLPQASNPNFRLDTIASDVESSAGSVCGEVFDGASKEQLGLLCQKQQSRAKNYKQKYRELSGAYQEVVRENEKYRVVLTRTQDKALQRIDKLKSEKREMTDRVKSLETQMEHNNHQIKVQKLQELLEKCKDRISQHKEHIASLTEQNTILKEKLVSLYQCFGIRNRLSCRLRRSWKMGNARLWKR